MRYRDLHRWDLTPEEAIEVQGRLRDRIDATGRPADVRRVAGVDVSYSKVTDRSYAVVALLDAADLSVLQIATAAGETSFPYVPGLLSFRELPAVEKAFEALDEAPDLVVVDGQGLAHPRRFGLACHLGLLIDRPTIGCAKTRLHGTHDEPGPERGAAAALVDGEETLGVVLRTRREVAPVYVSVGHRISLAACQEWILRLAPRFRLPEPIRVADSMTRQLRKAGEG